MVLLYLMIPLMALAVAIATAPLLWATRRESSWDEPATTRPTELGSRVGRARAKRHPGAGIRRDVAA